MKLLWWAFVAVNVGSFAILGWVGTRIYQTQPPTPAVVQSTDGRVLLTREDIQTGQNVWQSIGGMELGSVWGHGSYVAPDWTADYLHRECMSVLDTWAQREYHSRWETLPVEPRAALQARLESTTRNNTYDETTQAITIIPERAAAFEANLKHYSDIFTNGNDAYSIPAGALTDPAQLKALNAFFFWTSWAASTDRPNDEVTYTSNWPHEELVGNRPSGDTIVWTGVSIIMLLAGICAMVWYYVSRPYQPGPEEVPATDPLLGARATPSQLACVKYFWVVSALILVQILVGVITAHYGVEGNSFYGIDLAKWLPYSVVRTWHIQLGLFWIATAWLAAGLVIGPVVSGVEPAGQKFGVNFLFLALLVVVVGSLAGEYLSIHHQLSLSNSFLFGHQGYEYVDLGRVWQALLFVGLLLWLVLVLRSILPALKQPSDQRPLLVLFLISAIAIGGFYGAGLMWGRHTPLPIVEYWRWWVVHLWVEGFFEVFATVVIAFFFARLGLIRAKLAGEASLFSATIYLSGGIIGTLHHLYWSGTPTVALAFGSVFSALEVVPLVLVAYAAWEDVKMSRSTVWIRKYRWPIYYFVAVAFWNMVGAGLFGFMINPPIALYYMQGLNTTPVHGHAALFGVYGMLGIGLMLFCLRALRPAAEWHEGLLRLGFWCMNIGLFTMVVGSLLPVGLMQTWESVRHGYWSARSAEFMHTPTMQVLRWMRVPGDTIFAIGALALVLFVFGLATGHSIRSQPSIAKSQN